MEDLNYILPFSINGLKLITIIIGVVNYKKYKHTPLKYFLWFLVYGFLAEILIMVISVDFEKLNHIVYNIYSIVYFTFSFWLFFKYLKNKKNCFMANIFNVIIVIIFIINTLFFQDIYNSFQSYTWLFGSLFLIITIIIFFIELLNSEKILNLKHLLIFWVALGIFLFQLGFLPVFIATKYINYNNGLTYAYILLILNFITSLCYSLGFIWTKKKLNY